MSPIEAILGVSAIVALSAVSGVADTESKDIWLSSLDVHNIAQDLSEPGADTNLFGKPLSINGKAYDKGVSTHACSIVCVKMNGAVRFSAEVGIDDSSEKRGSVVFEIWGDKKLLWRSAEMKGGDAAVSVDIPVKNVKMLYLVATDDGDGIGYDYADWANAKFVVKGESPQILPVDDKPVILTPKPSPKPRINSPAIFGVRPGSPFLYTIAATGDRPITFSAEGLPDGLLLDSQTGRITGKLIQKGEIKVNLSAKNALGTASKTLTICIGDKIALTPPMGWNDWNCWGERIDQEKMLNAAKTIKKTGLADHGWSYVNIDDTWQGKRGGEFGALQGNEKFPDIAGLAEEVHSMGLKIGIYSTPWTKSYANFPGGSEDEIYLDKKPFYDRYHGRRSFAENDAKQWGAWKIDYLKYDWFPNDEEHIGEMEKDLKSLDRDIVYSLSNNSPVNIASYLKDHANCWRTTGDIRDKWGTVRDIMDAQVQWLPYMGPGHWIDPDMLVVGQVGWHGTMHKTELTPSEQYSHISMWCLLSSPLLIGCDLDQLDDFTLGLLTNDEVLAVDQDPLGKAPKLVRRSWNEKVWSKDLCNGSKAVGLFNFGQFPGKVQISWKELGVSGPQTVRDLWRQKDLGISEDGFEAEVNRHGVVLVNIKPVKE